MKTKLLLFLLIFVIIKANAQQEIYALSGLPVNFIKFKDKILFESYSEDSGSEIWQSDGISSNTSMLKDIYPGIESGSKGLLKRTSTILNGRLYFIAKDETSLGEIWKTDGTTNGTVKVTNFLNGRVLKLTAVGNSIYFLLKINDTLQVWKSDGSAEGTILIKDNLPIWNTPTFEGKCNNTFVFTFQDYGSNDSRVWRSDGTSEGTYPITSAMDGNGSGPGGTSALTQYIEKDNKLYFVSRYSLFETDGTLENTKTVGNLWNAQTRLVTSSDVIEADNNLYYMFFSDDYFALEIWKFNLTDRNTSNVYTTTSPQYFYPSNFEKTDNSLLFCGPNSTGGTSLLSMKLNDYAISNLKELAPSVEKPFIFLEGFDRGTIYKINADEYFVTSGIDKDYKRKGWITNTTTQVTENSTALDDVWDGISYQDYFYYGKDNKLMKYTHNLDTKSFDNKPSFILYPNPSADFIQINKNENDVIEDICIFDFNGKEVRKISEYNNDRIDISKLSRGVYILRAKLNEAFIEKKIIKN